MKLDILKLSMGSLTIYLQLSILTCGERCVDSALRPAIEAGIIPYGILWYPVNWLAVIGKYDLWLISLFLVNLGFLGLAWKKGPLTFGMFCVSSLFFFLGRQQNMTVLWLAFLGLYHIGFTAGSILMKLPVGWSLDLSDPHFRYLINAHGIFDHATWLGNLMGYALLLAWWSAPILLRIKR